MLKMLTECPAQVTSLPIMVLGEGHCVHGDLLVLLMCSGSAGGGWCLTDAAND